MNRIILLVLSMMIATGTVTAADDQLAAQRTYEIAADAAQAQMNVTSAKLVANIEELRHLFVVLADNDRSAFSKFSAEGGTLEDHAWVQFKDKYGNPTGCHDIDNQQSCSGPCPCQ